MQTLLYAILVITALLSAQFKEKEDFDPRQKLLSTNTSSGGLLDAERFSLDQTYSMSYSSGSAHSMATGAYVAGLNYRFSDPLSMKLELAASFMPYSTFSLPSDQKTQVYFKSATLDYRPNDTFRMKIRVEHNPGGAAGYNALNSRTFGQFGYYGPDDDLLGP